MVERPGLRPDTIQVGPPPSRRRRHKPPVVSSWILKTALAYSGAVWAVFVAIHLFGNLKVFQGADAFNSYAAWLRTALYPLLPRESLLWALRIVLLVSLVVHVWAAATLWLRARSARGPFRARLHGTRSLAAWLMPATGVAILLFLVAHVLDLTLGVAPVASGSFAPQAGEVVHAYENLVASFQRPVAAWSYIAMMLLLALHIAKGSTLLASDLGIMGRRWRATFALAGALLAVAVLLGNAAIPLLVQLGVLS